MEDRVIVYTATSGVIYSAKYVIIATPPNQTLGITFTPALPYQKTNLYKFMPIGHIIKVIITYQKVGFVDRWKVDNNLPGGRTTTL